MGEKPWLIDCKCGSSFEQGALREALQKHSNQVIHVRGDCPECGKFIKWVPYQYSKIIKKLVWTAYENLEATIYEDTESNNGGL